jgi:hypothetical protein
MSTPTTVVGVDDTPTQDELVQAMEEAIEEGQEEIEMSIEITNTAPYLNNCPEGEIFLFEAS